MENRKRNPVTTDYEFAFYHNGRVRIGSHFEATESGSDVIAAVKVFKNKRGDIVSRDQVVVDGTWVDNDENAYDKAIVARNKK